jgi:hypothetical protein
VTRRDRPRPSGTLAFMKTLDAMLGEALPQTTDLHDAVSGAMTDLDSRHIVVHQQNCMGTS